jgi:hypothetical protein
MHLIRFYCFSDIFLAPEILAAEDYIFWSSVFLFSKVFYINYSGSKKYIQHKKYSIFSETFNVNLKYLDLS